MKALTQAQVDCVPPRRLPVPHPRAHARRSRHLPRRACTGWKPTWVARRRGRREVALARLCPLALVQRPDPPSAHPRRHRGRDRPQYPGLDQHLLHQGAALADLRRLAPGRHLFRPGAAGAGLRLGRADRCHRRGRLHGDALEPAAPRASCTTRPLGLANSINRAGQTIMEPFDDTNPVAMALPAGSFSLHHELAVHRSAPNHAAHRRVGIGLNYIPTHVRVNSPVRLMAMLVRGEDTLRPFRPDRPAGSRTRRRRARRPSAGQRPLSRELQRAGQAPRGAVPDGRVTRAMMRRRATGATPCAHPAAPPTPCARSR